MLFPKDQDLKCCQKGTIPQKKVLLTDDGVIYALEELTAWYSKLTPAVTTTLLPSGRRGLWCLILFLSTVRQQEAASA